MALGPQQSRMQLMETYSYLSNAHPDYLDELYTAYQHNPDTLDPSWRHFFEGFEFSQRYRTGAEPTARSADALSETVHAKKEVAVHQLIHGYRSRAHLLSKTNPIRQRKDRKPRLSLADYTLSEADLDTVFVAGEELNLKGATLRQIIETLEHIYTGPIGFEYTYIREPEALEWLKRRIEHDMVHFQPSLETKHRILKRLNEAATFEQFLHTKYVGQKRFSLEGGENSITVLDTLMLTASELGVEEMVFGMAHRGRLNVLVNIMGKTYEQVFTEFEGVDNPGQTMGDGDVKYHLGYSSHRTLENGHTLYLKLCPNPSHLEAVDPVVLGYTRAQIDDEYRGDFKKAIPVLIHGDAAIAGQGIIYEVTQMAKLDGYTVGGCIHLVINNQIGFTTDFSDARSSIYCTDVAKIIDAPVFHVNGDDPEALAFVSQIAAEFRQQFGRDVFIDMVCYRRHGHNESDEPKFTQPKLYNLISGHPSPREVYNQRLIARGDVDAELAQRMDKEYWSLLQDRLNLAKQEPLPYQPQKLEEEWLELAYAQPSDFERSPDTAVSLALITRVGEALSQVPEGFKPIKKSEKLLEERRANFFDKKTLTWADAELLAYGSLLIDKHIVRLSGQDVMRGTFSHRHAVLFDAQTNARYCALDNLDPEQHRFQIYNSLLSEYGVLGFEYGYAMATPHALVVWEAQFGDFSNGAQVIIDQFISSAETKWQRMNGLVLLLPHGYEGQGPEHSNARPERFLQLAARYNMTVANVTQPANFFHLLRRQVAWPFRKPCVVMSPKSLLRHPECVSPLEQFTQGGFQEVIDDTYAEASTVKRLLLCTGKIYYELRQRQQQEQRKDVAIVRLEQLAPFPESQLDAILARYPQAEVCWVQEEPSNMGYWAYMLRVFRKAEPRVIARSVSASPATGYGKVHAREQKDIIDQAFAE
jgi:2-oxoglutarate dehydrogenase E1 component